MSLLHPEEGYTREGWRIVKAQMAEIDAKIKADKKAIKRMKRRRDREAVKAAREAIKAEEKRKAAKIKKISRKQRDYLRKLSQNYSEFIMARVTKRTKELFENMLEERGMTIRDILEEEVLNYYGFNCKLTIDGRKEVAQKVMDFLKGCIITNEKGGLEDRRFVFRNDECGVKLVIDVPKESGRAVYTNAHMKNPLEEWKKEYVKKETNTGRNRRKTKDVSRQA